MLTKDEKRLLRSDLFRYLDGLGTGPTAYTLHKKGVLDYLLKEQEVGLEDITKQFEANPGYMNVALRILCSQGWLTQLINNQTNEIRYKINEKSKIAFEHFYLYKEANELLILSGKYHKRLFQKEPFQAWLRVADKYQKTCGIEISKDELTSSIQNQILKHIEGMLVAPSVVSLGMSGMFHKYFMEASFRPEEFHKDSESFSYLLDFFVHLGWFFKKKETYGFTDKGLFFAKRASAFGVTVSYNPMFRELEELIFGDPNKIRDVKVGEAEKHVDREMNVWGSGGAHGTYFKKVDEIIISMFNKPIHEQPKGIVDMGCGNGAYLEHLYDVISQRTERGKLLDEHPLFLVGADYNQAALKVTRANLISADIWAKVIWGDIGRPDLLAQDLKDEYNIELRDLLSVRTFLDHNRIWEAPAMRTENRSSESKGAFVHRGEHLGNNAVEDNLLLHFKKWTPYVEKFGLLLIELHTVDPQLVAQNIGKTAATAYDATHGYSDQYIVEVDVFHKVAAEAGLELDNDHFYKFPNSDLATVTINLLKGKL